MCPSSSRTFIISICWTLSKTFLSLLEWSIIYVFKFIDMIHCVYEFVYCTNLASLMMYGFLYFISLNLVTEYAFEDFFQSFCIKKDWPTIFLCIPQILVSGLYWIHRMPPIIFITFLFCVIAWEALVSDPPWKYGTIQQWLHLILGSPL